ncbi:immunoglobulin I-set domain protein, partial [Ostertagia ostertagi]
DDVTLLPTSNVVFNKDNTIVNLLSTNLDDEGKYVCIAENSAGNTSRTTHLHVGVPPRIVDNTKREVVKHGEAAILRCEAMGVPKPSIAWMKDEQVIKKATEDASNAQWNSLVFENVSVNDAGVYTCEAENWVGIAHKDFDLVVISAPAVQPDKMEFTVHPRKTAILACNVTGIPEPVVSWVKAPNIEIEANER